MKKIVLVLAATLATVGLFSCSNGLYDANPDADYSNIPNPIVPIDNSPAKEGQIKFKLYDEYELYSNAYFMELGASRMITGLRTGTTNNYVISFTITDYSGVGEYSGLNDKVTATYIVFKDTTIIKTSQVQQSLFPESHITLEVKEDTGDRLTGTFEFKGINDFGGGDSIVVSEGTFNVKKQ